MIAVCMALLVLVSTTGFAMNAHFCGGELQRLAFSESDEVCAKHTPQPPCHQQTAGHENQPEPCCQDQQILSEPDQSLAETVSWSKLMSVMWVAEVVFYLVAGTPISDQSTDFFSCYSPPPLERDIPVLVQSFLI